ncbi:MAG TPA: hypothetical protein VKJ47_06775 [Candidatus Binatia bacterium]|nr:hypothetical protein [Candidatus Binatia bacterium]
MIGGETAQAYATTIISVNCIASVNSTHSPFPQALSAVAGEAPLTVIAKSATTRVNITAMIQESGTHRSVQRVSAKPKRGKIPVTFFSFACPNP